MRLTCFSQIRVHVFLYIDIGRIKPRCDAMRTLAGSPRRLDAHDARRRHDLPELVHADEVVLQAVRKGSRNFVQGERRAIGQGIHQAFNFVEALLVTSRYFSVTNHAGLVRVGGVDLPHASIMFWRHLAEREQVRPLVLAAHVPVVAN